jgi:hypothetical protein
MDECTHLQEPNISNQGLSMLIKYVCVVRTFRLMPPMPDTAVNKCYFRCTDEDVQDLQVSNKTSSKDHSESITPKDLEHGCLGNEGLVPHRSQAEPKFPEHPNSRSLILTQCKDLV